MTWTSINGSKVNLYSTKSVCLYKGVKEYDGYKEEENKDGQLLCYINVD